MKIQFVQNLHKLQMIEKHIIINSIICGDYRRYGLYEELSGVLARKTPEQRKQTGRIQNVRL